MTIPLSKSHQQLIQAWNTPNPVTKWECTRNKRITQSQGNNNPLVTKACKTQHLLSKSC
ncbi:endonuclease [Vibrio mediterranei]|uniref:endonuclease n=1 Tax=Vibrio mediterranei TaxID=689 RepID=UPI00148E0355|nr:endonuclease [Vibrio mediterranei]NOI26912.1 hypothetical protein [Vibrio mediterranei]